MCLCVWPNWGLFLVIHTLPQLLNGPHSMKKQEDLPQDRNVNLNLMTDCKFVSCTLGSYCINQKLRSSTPQVLSREVTEKYSSWQKLTWEIQYVWESFQGIYYLAMPLGPPGSLFILISPFLHHFLEHRGVLRDLRDKCDIQLQ